MKSLIKIAQKLDKSGQYKLADKIAQIIMDASQYANNPYTPNDVMNIRKQLIPTDFRGEIYQNKKGDTLLNTNDGMSFAVGLMDFARINNFPNVKSAFDAYANAGAKYRGQSIKQDPVLQELYKRVSKTTTSITRQMLQDEIQQIYRESLGMAGAKFESSNNAWERNIDPNTGADLGYLEYEYNQAMEYASEPQLIDLSKQINSDKYLNEELRQKLLNDVEFNNFKNKIETGNYSATLLEGFKNLTPEGITFEQKQFIDKLINQRIERYNNLQQSR
jgi:hypothetical protein